MKFSGKMCLMIILNVTKKHGFSLSVEDTFFEKPHGGQIDPLAVLRLKFHPATLALACQQGFFCQYLLSKIWITFFSRVSTNIQSHKVLNFKYHGKTFSLHPTILLNLLVNVMCIFVTQLFLVYCRWLFNTLYTVIHKL